MPALIDAADQRETLGRELGVTSHYVVWGAACMLWAQPEHTAHALVEAVNLQSVEQYFGSLLPSNWTTHSLPVFSTPTQIELAHQILAAPTVQPAASNEAATDTLEDRAINRVAVSQADTVERPSPPFDSTAVTRFVESPQAVARAEEPARIEPSTRVSETPAFSEGPTVILGPEKQRTSVLRLLGSSGPAQGATFEVGVAGATVGRLPDNSICLTDGRLSRQHARIDFKDDEYWLTDLGSQNGTVVNGQPVTEPYRLRAGDAVELGTSRLTVMFDSESGD